jgi:integrase
MPEVITKAIVADALKRHRSGLSFEMTDLRTKGLELRCRPKGVMWSFRWQTGKKSNRLALGPATAISLEEARWLALQAATALRMGVIVDTGWLAARYIDLGKVNRDDVAEGRSVAAGQWTFSEARKAYLEHVERTRSSTTHQDYRNILSGRDLAGLGPEQVSNISRQDLAEIIADVHRSGRETHADHIARVVRPFWTWLGQDAQIGRSGVRPDTMTTLRAPERSRVDDDDDEDEHGTYVPSLEEMGRAIALARSAAISTPIGCAIELLIWTVQRRRAIVEARVQDFIAVSETEGLWRVPPASRKGRKRNGKRKRPLVVPLPATVWACVQRAMKARPDQSNEWLFPADSKSGHMHTSTLSHMIGFLPGVTASGHDMRRGFATHGEAILGLLRADTKSILDHEDDTISVREITHRTATGATDMTGVHYSLHDGSHRTWPIMRAWVSALEPHVETALSDPLVNDRRWVGAQIANARRRQREGDAAAMRIAAE